MGGLLLLAAVFLFASRQRRRRRNPSRRGPNPSRRRPVLANIDAFTDEHGIIHPIRDSDGYEAEVEAIQQQGHERIRQARDFGVYARDERSGIQRPPWAIGISEGRLGEIAREYGISPSRERWWDTVGLSTGSGELRRLLEGNYQRSRRGSQETVMQRDKRIARRSTGKRRRRFAYFDPKDLPF